MTVGELIEFLSKLPADKVVVANRGEFGCGFELELEQIAVRRQSDPRYAWREFYPSWTPPTSRPASRCLYFEER